jgi:hypothetical protein
MSHRTSRLLSQLRVTYDNRHNFFSNLSGSESLVLLPFSQADGDF